MIPFSPTGLADDAIRDHARRAIAKGDRARLVAKAVQHRRATLEGEAGRLRRVIGRRVVGLGMWIGDLGTTPPVIEKG